MRRPRPTAGRLVLTLLPWLRPAGSRSPLPQHPALGARRRHRPQRALVGSLPGHAEAGARWVMPGGQCAVGQPKGAQQTARAPSWVKDAWWGLPGSQNLRAKWRFRKGSVGLLGGASAEHRYSWAEWEVLFSGGRNLERLERSLRTRPLRSCSWIQSAGSSDRNLPSPSFSSGP